jgi:antibiotic biosynthesis monooxygenase (ABM) superfamily enzyme
MTARHAHRETTAGDPLVVGSTWRCGAVDLVGRSGIVLHDAGSPEYHVARRFHDRRPMDAWLGSFLGAYPLVVLFQWLVAEHVEGLPLLVRSAILLLVLLSVMTYVMVPLVARVPAGWLEVQ